MAHFAKLDENNNVVEVHCVHNNELLDESGIENEQRGIDFLVNWSGGYPYWKQTSYNGTFRKNYAGVGFTYDADLDAFIPPKPFDSWVFDEDTCRWSAPVAIPSDGPYYWDEDNQQWVEISLNA